MEKKLHLIEVTVEIQFAGTDEEAKAFTDRLVDRVESDVEAETYCGEVPCCGPVAPLTGHVVYGHATYSVRDFSKHDTV
jgi:hypothetical protein